MRSKVYYVVGHSQWISGVSSSGDRCGVPAKVLHIEEYYLTCTVQSTEYVAVNAARVRKRVGVQACGCGHAHRSTGRNRFSLHPSYSSAWRWNIGARSEDDMFWSAVLVLCGRKSCDGPRQVQGEDRIGWVVGQGIERCMCVPGPIVGLVWWHISIWQSSHRLI